MRQKKQIDILDILLILGLALQVYSIVENDKMEKKIDKLLKGVNNARKTNENKS